MSRLCHHKTAVKEVRTHLVLRHCCDSIYSIVNYEFQVAWGPPFNRHNAVTSRKFKHTPTTLSGMGSHFLKQ
jgi:hypothetical protein